MLKTIYEKYKNWIVVILIGLFCFKSCQSCSRSRQLEFNNIKHIEIIEKYNDDIDSLNKTIQIINDSLNLYKVTNEILKDNIDMLKFTNKHYQQTNKTLIQTNKEILNKEI